MSHSNPRPGLSQPPSLQSLVYTPRNAANSSMQYLHAYGQGESAASASAFSLSTSTTLVDGNNASSSVHYASVAPVNIPPNRMHNRQNRSAGSVCEFQSSSPWSVVTDYSPRARTPGIESFNRRNPFDYVSPPTNRQESYPPDRATTNNKDVAFAENHRSSSLLSLTSKPTLSSSYALKVVFDQFQTMADKKMEDILNKGVVSGKCFPTQGSSITHRYNIRKLKSIFASCSLKALIRHLTRSYILLPLWQRANRNQLSMRSWGGDGKRLNLLIQH